MGKTDEKRLAENRAYWARNSEDINRRRRERYKVKQAERKAREQAYREQAQQFLADVEADEEATAFMRAVLDGEDPMKLIEAWAKRKAETERDNE